MAADPKQDDVVVEEVDSDGDPYIWWYTTTERDPRTCRHCAAGTCVQVVMRAAYLNEDFVRHENPRKDMN